MNESEAGEVFDAAFDAWESGNDQDFIEYAGVFNEWLMDQGGSPMMPEDWYPEDREMQDAMWDWIDTLSHDEREEFFGY